MNGLDLFSGIGGLSLALEPWVRTITYCESDRYAQAVLMSRMRHAQLEHAPIWDDVRTLRGEQLLARVEIIMGGFPCQDISVAGHGAGLAGERSGLFFEIIRLVDELRPRFVFLENVPAIRTRGLATVIGEFARLGYDCRWTIVSAAELGAPHLRKRWFMLATDTECNECRNEPRGGSGTQGKGAPVTGNNGATESLANTQGIGWGEGRTESAREQRRPNSAIGGSSVADTERIGLEEPHGTEAWTTDSFTNPSWWAIEPDVGRVVDGLPNRVDRLRCLGNAVVPLQAREAFKKLSGVK